MKIPITKIEVWGLQARASTDQSVVADYTEAMRAGVKLPPIVVFKDAEGQLFLADGFHRVLAAERVGQPLIEAEIKKGRRDDANWFAAGANKTHGLRRTGADKRKAVGIALKIQPELSDRAIADHCGVGDHLVAELRRLQVRENAPEDSRNSGFIGNSDSQVRENAPEGPPPGPPSGPPEMDVRVGRDGKKYPAPPPMPPPDKPLDKIGRVIPENVLATWERGQEAAAKIRAISQVRCDLRDAQEQGDPLYRGVNFSVVLLQLDQAYAGLKVAIPYAICPTCQGEAPKCRLCKGSGIVSEYVWDTIVPKETKAAVLKSLK